MIEVEHLSKYYGNFMAIEDISFKVEKGEILGFLGPNGAGKTTTMRILTGYMPPTSGTARIAGYDIFFDSLKARREIGYLPESNPLYGDMSVRALLEFFGKLRGLDKKYLKRRISEVIEKMRLEEYAETDINKMSKGFRQRVGVAQAILHEPAVLILDEPTIGIDPVQVVETRQIIKELGKEHTIILSTHILPEVSMVCQKVIIVNEGHLIAADRPENLSIGISGQDKIKAVVRGPMREVAAALRDLNGVETVDYESTGVDGTARFNVSARINRDIREDLSKLIVNRGWGLLEMQPVGLSLEDVFVKLTTKEEI
ncbi:MAG: ATP-binding cassette domain-containing protein [Dehalococcoidia bacterium]|nr:ATP-binding cassette domain-containing protein [Dehalococcoidia bacterium]